MRWTFHRVRTATDRCRNLSARFVEIGLVVFAFTFAFSVSSPAVRAAAPARANKNVGDVFFADSAVRTFSLEIPPAGITALRRSPREYVEATVRFGDRVLTNVGVHLKGMGSFRGIDEKASFVVKFDHFVPDQEYEGLTKLMLNNAAQDPTFLAEWLATGLFRDAGLPAARVTHSRVHLNNTDLGLYVVIEAMNKRFLKKNFGNAKGNLYESYLHDIDARMEQDNGDPGDQADIHALAQACLIEDPAARLVRVRQLLDVDRFFSFAAMELLVGHWDGYTIHTNNYRVYHDADTDRMVFITHGLDWAFRRPNLSIDPPLKSLVGRALFQIPEQRAIFRQRIGTLFTNVFNVSRITNRMEQGLAKLRAHGQLDAATRARMERSAESIRERIVLRGVRVAEQLAGHPPPLTKFDSQQTATLNGWRDETDRGEMIMDQPTLGGHATLHLRAAGGNARGSWRTQVYLPRGLYRFEGMARCENVSGGSAGLRISGGQRRSGLSGNVDEWRSVTHEFSVREDAMDVEFVCDFYALRGDVWFDQDAFRLRRLGDIQ